MDLGVGGRGGARRRTRRRANARASMQTSSQQQSEPSNSPSAMLDMLKVLHNEGILTDEEFTAKKALLVDKM